MIELAVRVPIQLSPAASRLVLIIGVVIVAAILVGGLIETVFGGVTATILRLTGHPPPRKSSFGAALDEMDARLNRRK